MAKPESKKLYIIGSLRNEGVPTLAKGLRATFPGLDIFDDWYAAGETADDSWRDYERARGRTYAEALKGRAANHVFNYDKSHLDSSDLVVLLLPAGKSGHLEAGYCIGKGKPVAILVDDPDRWDVMYLFADTVCHDAKELVEWIEENLK